MPPGSKKRRAAKKKMENQSNNHANPSSASAHSHGNQFVNHHDEKGNDVGEVSSPGSRDHHNPSTEELKINDTVVHVERDFEIEGKMGRENGRVVEHDGSMMKSYNGMSFSSSSNSSDDEVRGIKNSRTTEDEIYTLSERSFEAYQSVPIEEVKQVEVGSLLQENEKAIVQSVDKTAGVLNATQETDDRLMLPYDNGVEQEKECVVTEPLLDPSPRPDKKSSWKSCCGLFDVFCGSGR